MAFDIKAFYRNLDASYDAHDLEATETFLLTMQQETASSPVVTSGSEGCMSCAPSLSVNLDFVCVTNELGCFYRGLSRWNEAIAAFDAAQAEMEQYYATDSPEYGVVLLNKAGVYRYMGNLVQALETFEKAKQRLEENERTPAATLAGLYNNIGLVYLDMKDPSSAVGLFSQAMLLLGDLNEHQVEYGTTCNNLASAFDRLGQQNDAMHAAEMAVNALSTLDNGLNCHFPAALNTRGIIHYHMGDYEGALIDFSVAAEKTRILYGENIEYASACANCADCCAQLGRTAQGQDWKQKAASVLSRLKA